MRLNGVTIARPHAEKEAFCRVLPSQYLCFAFSSGPLPCC